MTNLADLQTERERLHAAEAKTAFEAALAETCDAKDMLAAALSVRKLMLSAIDAAAVRREAGSLGAMLRAGIERVIDQTAPRLAAASNDMERRLILDKEIRRLRWMMKREMPRALRRMKDAVGHGKKPGEST